MPDLITFFKAFAITVLPIILGIYLYKKLYKIFGILLIITGLVIAGSLIYAIKTFQ